MLIAINDQWRIRSESRAWAVQKRREKCDRWDSEVWYNTLDQVGHYLQRNGVPLGDLERVEGQLQCQNPLDEDGTRPYCWQFDHIYPPNSPAAGFLSDKSILQRFGRAPNVLQPASPLNEGKKAPLPKCIQPENGSPNGVVIQVNDSWRIRPVQGDWNIERLYSKKTAWTFEAHCRTLLDAVNTMLRRRVWLIDEKDVQRIVAERERIRNEVLAGVRKFEETLEAGSIGNADSEDTKWDLASDRQDISEGVRQEPRGIRGRARVRGCREPALWDLVSACDAR